MSPLFPFLVTINSVAVFKHNALTVSLNMAYKHTFVCFINRSFMATYVTHMETRPIKPWLISTEKVVHKLTHFERGFKTLFDVLF